jgi:hypothetical protein
VAGVFLLQLALCRNGKKVADGDAP